MTMVETMAEAGAVLRDRRTQLGWSQANVAARARVSREWLVAVENGKGRFDFQRYLAVCDALDLDVHVTARTNDA